MARIDQTAALVRSQMLVGVSAAALLIAAPAQAQAPVPDPTQDPNAAQSQDTVQDERGRNVPEGATAETDASTIVVTGSRIRQPEFTSPDPVTLIDPTTRAARRQAGPRGNAAVVADRCRIDADHFGDLVELRHQRRSRRANDRPPRSGREPHAGPAQRPARGPRRYARRRVLFRPQRSSAIDRQPGRHPEDRRFVDLWLRRRCGRGQPDHEDRHRRFPARLRTSRRRSTAAASQYRIAGYVG